MPAASCETLAFYKFTQLTSAILITTAKLKQSNTVIDNDAYIFFFLSLAAKLLDVQPCSEWYGPGS
jgi:hypothetical protein